MTSPRAQTAPGPIDRPGWRHVVGGTVWIAALLAVVVLLHRVGLGTLSTPPLLDRSELRLWLDARDAVTVAFALIRLVALALGWYLLVVTVFGLTARVTQIPALVRVTDMATVPAVRRVLGAIAGVGLTASAATLVATSVLGDRPAPVESTTDAIGDVVLQRLPDTSSARLRHLPDTRTEDGTSTQKRISGDQGDPRATTWTAQPGDHLWHIAEATLADAWGRPPTDGEVTPYWQTLVDSNRNALADPSNPDLIYGGQTFALPTPPPPPPPPPGTPAPAPAQPGPQGP